MPKPVEEDDESYYMLPPGGGDPVRVAKTPGTTEAVNAPDAPAQTLVKHPWEDWDAKKRAQMDKAVALADNIKLYRSAGGIGINSAFAPHSAALSQRGGLSEDEATTLARYKMFKETTGGDPEWQGPLNINTGPREKAETEAELAAKRDAYFNATTDQRALMMANEKGAVDRSRESYFDSLVPKDNAAIGKVLAANAMPKKKRA